MTLGSFRSLAAVTAGGGVIALAATGGDLAGMALRGTAVVALLGLGAAALRRRSATGGPTVLAVLERHPVGRETGVAVLAAEGRRMVIGYGPAGVALLTELSPLKESAP